MFFLHEDMDYKSNNRSLCFYHCYQQVYFTVASWLLVN